MKPDYTLHDTDSIYTPSLLFYKELIQNNIARTLKIAKDPSRLRPHVKTHKTPQIVDMELEMGITKHKCATIAEAEMLANCGVLDILIAYPMVGPNCHRIANLIQKYPNIQFAVLMDNPQAAKNLSAVMTQAGQQVGVFVDINVGQDRTGITPGDAAADLYKLLEELPSLEVRGLQVYDGHNHQTDFGERASAVNAQLAPVLEFRERLVRQGHSVPTIVVGGTPTFPLYAEMEIPGLECSPGTCILHDHGYGERFPDMSGFVPAAIVLTRVISKPRQNRLTLDLGHKAIAADPPAGKRSKLINVPEYQTLLQNEEHMVIETSAADQFQIGSEIYAIPTHICPTCNIHQQAYVIENGKVVDQWEIAGRDRVLTV
ncbi:MAG: D-TA family PLP-dependent enzyme [Gemmataceae bacterium]